MSRLVWDALRDRRYERGVDHGVLYVWDQTLNEGKGDYGTGVVWNGLTGVTESPSGAEPNAFWADNQKYLNLLSAEDFGCTIEAYTYPALFRKCIGKKELAPGVSIGQQKRSTFAFCFRTKIGDAVTPDSGYILHLVYGAMASPSEEQNSTINDSPEPKTLSWEISTTPINVPGMKPTALFLFDSRIYKKKGLMNVMHAVEDILYGTEEEDSRIIKLSEIGEIYAYQRYLRDANEEVILDSAGDPIFGSVYD